VAAHKGIIPAYVKRKTFLHPGQDEAFIQILECVEDPRKASLFARHSLVTILFMVIVANICGVHEWAHIVTFSTGILDWIRQYVDAPHGVPHARTFQRVMCLLDPNTLEELLIRVADNIREKTPQERIAVEGNG
jgi:hypothetical protein